MDRVSKTLALFLMAIIVMSDLTLLIAKPANAQTIPTPSVPQFTIKFINASYSATTTNPFNGQSQTQQISNNSIEIIINNQPFDYSYNGTTYQVYYNIRIKPHFNNTVPFQEVFSLVSLASSPPNSNGISSYAWYLQADTPIQSSTRFTTVTALLVPVALGYDLSYYAGNQSDNSLPLFSWTVPTNAQIDFQVEALVGHDSQFWHPEWYTYPSVPAGFSSAVAFDSTSGWSNTQTLNLTDGLDYTTSSTNLTPTPTTIVNPTSNPTISEFPTLMIVPFLLSVFFVVLAVRYRKVTYE